MRTWLTLFLTFVGASAAIAEPRSIERGRITVVDGDTVRVGGERIARDLAATS
jgi:hypothetical protein